MRDVLARRLLYGSVYDMLDVTVKEKSKRKGNTNKQRRKRRGRKEEKKEG